MENPFEIILEKLNLIEKLLIEMKMNKFDYSEVSTDNHGVLDMKQASKFLSISKSTLYGYTSQRKIPHCKTGKKIYFKVSELADWLSKKKIKTMDEIEQEANNYILKNRKFRS